MHDKQIPQQDQSFSELITKAVAERMTPEFVEEQVLARTDKLITDAVDNALRSYSATGKVIDEAVKEALKVERLDLPAYGVTVAAILKSQIDEKVSGLVATKLAEDMDELLNLAPKEVRLSEIADYMRQEHESEGSYGPVITVIVEYSDYSDGYAHIYLDERNAETQKNLCDISLHVAPDGKILSARLGRHDIKSNTFVGRQYGLEQRILAYYGCGTRLIVDEENVVTSVGDY